MKSNELSHIASLARLSITTDEWDALLPDLRALVSLADTLMETETETLSVPSLESVYREDTVLPYAERNALLSAAPCTEDEYITVPRVVKEGRHD